MKKINIFFLILFILFWAVNAQAKDVNICVLLDLSDRILKPQQIERDKKIILNIVSTFNNIIRKKKYIYSKDSLNIIIAHQPHNINLNKFLIDPNTNLKIDLQQLNYLKKSKEYSEFSKQIGSNIDKLYNIAKDNKIFFGADIWSFFKNNLQNYIKRDYTNILIILTDGYINFEDEHEKPKEKNKTSYMEVSKFRNNPKWQTKFDSENYGLIPAGNFDNLNVIVLEIAPKSQNNVEFDIIKKYFEKWFKEMKIKNYFINQNNMADLDQVVTIINKFKNE